VPVIVVDNTPDALFSRLMHRKKKEELKREGIPIQMAKEYYSSLELGIFTPGNKTGIPVSIDPMLLFSFMEDLEVGIQESIIEALTYVITSSFKNITKEDQKDLFDPVFNVFYDLVRRKVAITSLTELYDFLIENSEILAISPEQLEKITKSLESFLTERKYLAYRQGILLNPHDLLVSKSEKHPVSIINLSSIADIEVRSNFLTLFIILLNIWTKKHDPEPFLLVFSNLSSNLSFKSPKNSIYEVWKDFIQFSSSNKTSCVFSFSENSPNNQLILQYASFQLIGKVESIETILKEGSRAKYVTKYAQVYDMLTKLQQKDFLVVGDDEIENIFTIRDSYSQNEGESPSDFRKIISKSISQYFDKLLAPVQKGEDIPTELLDEIDVPIAVSSSLRLNVTTSKELLIGRSIQEHNEIGNSGLSILGANYEDTIWRGLPCYFDFYKPHLIFIAGARGSGRNSTLRVVLEGIDQCTIKDGISHSTIIIDSSHTFTSLDSITDEKKLAVIEKWGIKPKKLSNVTVYLPQGDLAQFQTKEDNINYKKLAIRPVDLGEEDWEYLLSSIAPLTGPMKNCLLDILRHFEQKSIINYSIGFMIHRIGTSSQLDDDYTSGTLNGLRNRLKTLAATNLFSKDGILINQLIQAGNISILQMSSVVSSSIIETMGSILCRKILSLIRQPRPHNLWLFLDRAHTLFPKTKKTPTSNMITRFCEIGPNRGLSLVLSSNQPATTSTKLLNFMDIVMLHQMSPNTVKQLSTQMPKPMPDAFKRETSSSISSFRPGIAVVFDRTPGNERGFVVKVRPSFIGRETRDKQIKVVKRPKTFPSENNSTDITPIFPDVPKELEIEMIEEKEKILTAGEENWELIKTIRKVSNIVARAAKEGKKDIEADGREYLKILLKRAHGRGIDVKKIKQLVHDNRKSK
ncbi:MAG: ATP-binding protein, partial [Promethearchaeota archaeon]